MLTFSFPNVTMVRGDLHFLPFPVEDVYGDRHSSAFIFEQPDLRLVRVFQHLTPTP